MQLPKYLWINNTQYYLYSVYPDSDFNELRKYCQRQKKRNGTRYYIRTFRTLDLFEPVKHALYLKKTHNLKHINTNFKRDPNDKRWQHTKWY